MNAPPAKRIEAKLAHELGPRIAELLSDDAVVEIAVNPNSEIWVERLGSPMARAGEFDPVRARAVIGTLAAIHETTVTADSPTLGCEMPDGSRFQGLIPPVVASPAFSIRRRASRVIPLSDFVQGGVLEPGAEELIRTFVARRKNILVAGGTGSGKTTLTNAIVREMLDADPAQRLVIIEDTREIRAAAPNAVQLRTTDRTSALDLLRATLRIRPDRIVVGEVRAGGPALEMLKAWNTGHPGGVATIHANGAAAALTRLEALLAEESRGGLQMQIGAAVDAVVAIAKDGAVPAGRRVAEILEVEGYDCAAGEYRTISRSYPS